MVITEFFTKDPVQTLAPIDLHPGSRPTLSPCCSAAADRGCRLSAFPAPVERRRHFRDQIGAARTAARAPSVSDKADAKLLVIKLLGAFSTMKIIPRRAVAG